MRFLKRAVTALPLMVAGGTLLAPGLPHAQTGSPAAGSPVAGAWSGEVQIANRPVGLTIVFQTTQGRLTGVARLAAPMNCRMTQDYAGNRKVDGKPIMVFEIVQTDGGFCDRLGRGTLEVTLADDTQLNATFKDVRGQSPIQARMTRDAAR
ncbi:hypothetical protein [Azospirillum sp. B4]|uniref:hypothetical protein n=1 Tax=Azospirillum sp. B4 TaxID=95605 RepID=UPI0003490946|nr:hypothetical protein [Azospirillum sp. B4]